MLWMLSQFYWTGQDRSEPTPGTSMHLQASTETKKTQSKLYVYDLESLGFCCASVSASLDTLQKWKFTFSDISVGLCHSSVCPVASMQSTVARIATHWYSLEPSNKMKMPGFFPLHLPWQLCPTYIKEEDASYKRERKQRHDMTVTDLAVVKMDWAWTWFHQLSYLWSRMGV